MITEEARQIQIMLGHMIQFMPPTETDEGRQARSIAAVLAAKSKAVLPVGEAKLGSPQVLDGWGKARVDQPTSPPTSSTPPATSSTKSSTASK